MDHAPEISPISHGTTTTEHVRVPKETLQSMLEQYRRVLQLLEEEVSDPEEHQVDSGVRCGLDNQHPSPPPSDVDSEEADQLCDLLKSKVQSPQFLDILGSLHMSISKNISGDEGATWDIVTARDLWEDKHLDGNSDSDSDEYILVGQEDIVDGMACFMAAYLLSLKETKDFSPDQLQEVLCKTFSGKKKTSRLRKAWNGSKVIYNVASWSATAIGIYQNPAILQAASVAFWTSCRAISRLL